MNTAVLGAVGFYSYKHWDAPRWDRRVVSAVLSCAAVMGRDAVSTKRRGQR